jgi:hypothetical protein
MPLPGYNPFAPPIFPAQQPAPNPMLAGRQPAPSYNTPLSPLDEFAYRQWAQQNQVPTDPNSTAPQDYDMRGFYQGLQQGNPRAQSAIDPNDSRLHFPDFWKTPMHQTFSNESQWAPSTAPQWTPTDQLAQPNGQVVFDDKAQNAGGLLSMLGIK